MSEQPGPRSDLKQVIDECRELFSKLSDKNRALSEEWNAIAERLYPPVPESVALPSEVDVPPAKHFGDSLLTLHAQFFETCRSLLEARLEIDSLRSERTARETELARFSEQVMLLGRAQGEANERFGYFERELAAAANARRAAEEQLARLEGRLQEADRAQAALEEKLRAAQSLSLTLEQRVGERERDLDRLAAELARAKEEKETALAARSVVESGLSEAESRHRLVAERLASVENQQENLHRQLESLERELNSWKTRAEALESDLQAARSKGVEMEAVAAAARKRNVELDGELSALRGALSDREAELDRARSRTEELVSEGRELRERIGALEAELGSLSQGADGWRHEKGELERSLEEKEVALHAARGRVQALEAELQGVRARAAEFQAALQAAELRSRDLERLAGIALETSVPAVDHEDLRKRMDAIEEERRVQAVQEGYHIETIGRLEAEMEAARRDLSEAQALLSAAQSREREIEEPLRLSEARNRELEERLEQALAELQAARAELAARPVSPELPCIRVDAPLEEEVSPGIPVESGPAEDLPVEADAISEAPWPETLRDESSRALESELLGSVDPRRFDELEAFQTPSAPPAIDSLALREDDLLFESFTKGAEFGELEASGLVTEPSLEPADMVPLEAPRSLAETGEVSPDPLPEIAAPIEALLPATFPSDAARTEPPAEAPSKTLDFPYPEITGARMDHFRAKTVLLVGGDERFLSDYQHLFGMVEADLFYYPSVIHLEKQGLKRNVKDCHVVVVFGRATHEPGVLRLRQVAEEFGRPMLEHHSSGLVSLYHRLQRMNSEL